LADRTSARSIPSQEACERQVRLLRDELARSTNLRWAAQLTTMLFDYELEAAKLRRLPF
jgi:hypothetical protein